MEIIANNIDGKGKTRKSKDLKEGKCVFPFKYKGVHNNSCVKGASGDWCATSLSKRGAYKTWGYCTKKRKSTTKSSSKTSSSSKKSSSNKKSFDRDKQIKYLKSVCIDPYDGILIEDFEDWEDIDLQDAILIGPKGKKRCYKVETIYRWLEDSIIAGKPLKDPINISYFIKPEEFEHIKNTMRKRIGPEYKSPIEKKIILDEKFVELLISDPNETWKRVPKKYIPLYRGTLNYPFYHIQIRINNFPISEYRYIDLGFIPAGIEPNLGDDQYLSSYSLVSSIRKLWDMRKLLLVHHPLRNIDCCTVQLSKPVHYWFSRDGSIDKQKLSSFGEDLRYQELM